MDDRPLPITAELRGAATPSATSNRLCTFTIDEFNRLCDAIDAVHSQLEHDCEMWRDRAVDMRMERDDALREHHDFAPESHYMLLPKDADGVPIHVGDVMEWPDGETFEVVGVGDGTLFYLDGGQDDAADWTGASTKRHHHVPTVENVLRDYWHAMDAAVTPNDMMAVTDKYAAKLRLAGDADGQ